jgi:hypothetical protein
MEGRIRQNFTFQGYEFGNNFSLEELKFQIV